MNFFYYFSNLLQVNISIGSSANSIIIGKYNEMIIENYFIDFDYKSLENQIHNTINNDKQDDLLKKSIFAL